MPRPPPVRVPLAARERIPARAQAAQFLVRTTRSAPVTATPSPAVISHVKNFFSVGNVCTTRCVGHVCNAHGTVAARVTVHSSPQEDQTKGEALRFEIMRLDDVDGTAVDSTVVDAASVNRIVQQAASIGQRIYIRPADSTAR
ncbi:hypothetical protein GCM10010507_59690 [Streptomyces cinnamoneus]|uniref:Uncharacterized protein n=1 Tax=Streptomyces cinnamoneus TaxID=53446 RepID=A0A918U0X4_STRCJ|nr:hypothetical protein GCM10010507_59690 [Streptomyces cinnamoneus]